VPGPQPDPFINRPIDACPLMRWSATRSLFIVVVLALGLVAAPSIAAGGLGFTQREWWLEQHALGLAWQGESPWLFALGFVALFTVLAAFTLPGCAPLCLFAGSCYGAVGGTLIVGAASTLGALLSFLAARHFARQRVQRRFGHRLHSLDTAVSRHGWPWVFWLRLVPVVPYPLLNPLLGLSRLSMRGFLWSSFAGLTIGSVPYVWAGWSLAGTLHSGSPDWATLAGAAMLMLAITMTGHRWMRRRGTGADR
jgi:uncharacterized membrane protein YdjX (TVP38/TMEM64 family)